MTDLQAQTDAELLDKAWRLARAKSLYFATKSNYYLLFRKGKMKGTLVAKRHSLKSLISAINKA